MKYHSSDDRVVDPTRRQFVQGLTASAFLAGLAPSGLLAAPATSNQSVSAKWKYVRLNAR